MAKSKYQLVRAELKKMMIRDGWDPGFMAYNKDIFDALARGIVDGTVSLDPPKSKIEPMNKVKLNTKNPRYASQW